MGVPLVRSANPAYPAVPLLPAVIAGDAFLPSDQPYRNCDLCTDSGEVRHVSKLVIPMGGSVVIFRLCLDCRCDLSVDFPDLVWC